MIEDHSRIVISGASQGIGRALARHFASKGHKIFLLDINEEGLKHTAETHLKQYSDRVSYAQCDLTNTDAIRSTIKKAAEYLGGRIDFLINNAGISTPYWKDGQTIADPQTLDQWKMYVDVNMTGTFAVSQACIPYMKVESSEDKQKLPGSQVGGAGPCIVIVSSFRAVISDPNQEGYSSTKAGLLGLSKSMAVSLASFGIRVNTVSPGRIKVTQESKQGDKNGEVWKNEEDDAVKHLSNRAGLPEDITEAVEYMLGAGFVSGQNLIVDGGVSVMK